nr:immunoglobulin light chain junction region [Macaca mulatta]MOW27725.1 immunoglobulin light chain junction region [Macaca mulatta]MOW27964.1 immunoglobulin light chain junction region [Macaca mulatta]MOW28361.1 immunoglobulin light chain junction region [Macaca mulatta]MOW29508.1 immunoglobulin light chain junction region [Macaca mulatta]
DYYCCSYTASNTWVF